MFAKASAAGGSEVLPGIRRKTLAHGQRTLFAEFHLEKGSALPRHSHLHEQTGYLVKGSLSFTIGEETYRAGPGDCWCIKGGVEHQVVALEDSVALEVFSPVREDYLPGAAKES